MSHPSTRRAALATALAAASATACVRVTAVPFGAGPFPPVPADSVRVFATLTPTDYTEIAVLRVKYTAWKDAAALRALRERAGRLGANGLLLLNTRGPAPGAARGSGTVVGGAEAGTVVAVGGASDVDDLERAVAIRIAPLRP